MRRRHEQHGDAWLAERAMPFGQWLRWHRWKHGISLEGMARLLGQTPRQVSLLETGPPQDLSVATLWQLCVAYQVGKKMAARKLMEFWHWHKTGQAEPRQERLMRMEQYAERPDAQWRKRIAYLPKQEEVPPDVPTTPQDAGQGADDPETFGDERAGDGLLPDAPVEEAGGGDS